MGSYIPILGGNHVSVRCPLCDHLKLECASCLQKSCNELKENRIITGSCVCWCTKYTCLWIQGVKDSQIPQIWDYVFSFVWHMLQHFQLLSKLVHQHRFHVVSSCGWPAAVHAAHQCVVPQGSLPCLPFLAAATQGVVSNVVFGWSARKSYYLLIGFVLALLCPIANCLSRIRSTIRCLSAVLRAFCVQD